MIKFGPSGNCESFYAEGFSHTEEAAAFVKKRGLDCFEYSFGRGVRMSEDKAISIGEAFAAEGVEISAHAPYFINFANPDDEMAAKSYGYVLDTAQALKLMGGKRVVFHPAAQGKATREEAVALTVERLKVLRDYIYLNNMQDMIFCPETMGKINQLGNLDEVLTFCKLDERFIPCIDFGHLNSRTGGELNSREAFAALLDRLVNELGEQRGRSFHAHFSKIEYTKGGEKRHLTFEDELYGPDPGPLMTLIAERGLTPTFICESDGTQAEDARTLMQLYGGNAI